MQHDQREQIRRATPFYGDLRGARYGDPEDEGYVPLSPVHPLMRRLRERRSRSNAPMRRYGFEFAPGRPERGRGRGTKSWRYDASEFREPEGVRGRGDYDAGFRPLRPDDALARAVRRDTEDLVTSYLREERYGEDYARGFGLRTRGPGDRLQDAARRLSGRGYDR
jgi:hypothetical protein